MCKLVLVRPSSRHLKGFLFLPVSLHSEEELAKEVCLSNSCKIDTISACYCTPPISICLHVNSIFASFMPDTPRSKVMGSLVSLYQVIQL